MAQGLCGDAPRGAGDQRRAHTARLARRAPPAPAAVQGQAPPAHRRHRRSAARCGPQRRVGHGLLLRRDRPCAPHQTAQHRRRVHARPSASTPPTASAPTTSSSPSSASSPSEAPQLTCAWTTAPRSSPRRCAIGAASGAPTPPTSSPARPGRTPYAESFNGHLRDECLSTEDFADLLEAQVVLETGEPNLTPTGSTNPSPGSPPPPTLSTGSNKTNQHTHNAWTQPCPLTSAVIESARLLQLHRGAIQANSSPHGAHRTVGKESKSHSDHLDRPDNFPVQYLQLAPLHFDCN